MKLVGVSSSDLKTIVKILRKHVSSRAVWAFGSRVKGPAKEFSDLDIAVIGDEPLSGEIIMALAEAFRESDLPFKVDIVDWAAASESFRAIIKNNYSVLQNPSGGQN